MQIKLNAGDKNAKIIEDVRLKNCYCGGKAVLVRLINAGGVPYSSIYCENCGEVWNIESKLEKRMLMKWGQQ